MNNQNIDGILDAAMEEFKTLTPEQHISIMNNPDYDGLFHVIDDMLTLDNNQHAPNNLYNFSFSGTQDVSLCSSIPHLGHGGKTLCNNAVTQ